MNQRTHAWLATRAVALLKDSGEADELVKLLAPYVKSVSIGAWLPDLGDSKKGFGSIDNHVLKMKPYKGKLKSRFVTKKKDLIKKLGPDRKMTEFIKSNKLGADWWNSAFKASPPPGKHLANRAMGFGVNLVDFLILGDKDIDTLVPGDIDFIDKVDPKARTRKQQAATYFFMLSHFVADACMPCHVDARILSSYSGSKKKKVKAHLHKNMEARWSKRITTYFDNKKLEVKKPSSAKMIKQSKKISDDLGITFGNSIPDLKNKDIWLEMIYICRGSYAMINIIAPYKKYKPKGLKAPKLVELYPGDAGETEMRELDKIILHDAVLNIAIIWKHIWEKFE